MVNKSYMINEFCITVSSKSHINLSSIPRHFNDKIPHFYYIDRLLYSQLLLHFYQYNSICVTFNKCKMYKRWMDQACLMLYANKHYEHRYSVIVFI